MLVMAVAHKDTRTHTFAHGCAVVGDASSAVKIVSQNTQSIERHTKKKQSGGCFVGPHYWP